MENATEYDPEYNPEDWEIGVPMNGGGWNRLRRIDLSAYKIPDYGRMGLARVVNKLQFKGFRGDFTENNKPNVLPRQVVEAAWIDSLLFYFGQERIDDVMRSKGWDVEQAKAWKQNLLARGCAQRHNPEAERYWRDQAEMYPNMGEQFRKIDDTTPTKEYIGEDGCSYDDFSEDEGRPMRKPEQSQGPGQDDNMDVDEQDGEGADADGDDNGADTGLEEDFERMEIE